MGRAWTEDFRSPMSLDFSSVHVCTLCSEFMIVLSCTPAWWYHSLRGLFTILFEFIVLEGSLASRHNISGIGIRCFGLHRHIGMSEYGPQLPSGFKKKSKETQEKPVQLPSEDSHDKVQNVGRTYGPVLPSGFRPANELKDEESDASASSVSAPQTIGPTLPPDLLAHSPNSHKEQETSSRRQVGPTLPPGFERGADDPSTDARSLTVDDEEDDGPVVGPSLSLMASESDFSAAEEVARRMERQAERIRKAQEPVVQERESWMTDLPEALLGRNVAALLPTAARTFKRRAEDSEADFSGWTAGPDKKNKKPGEKEKDSIEVLQYQQALERERKLEEEVARHNKDKRGEALAAIVQKNKKPESATERRPFDRERDLNIRKTVKMDDKEIAKRADALRDRFSSSSSSGQKFL